MDDVAQLKVELTRTSHDRVAVALEGELNIYTSSQLNGVLLESIADGVRQVVVDLSRLSAIDSTGLGLLVSCAKRLPPVGGTLEVVCRNENISRVFKSIGLDRFLGVQQSRQETP